MDYSNVDIPSAVDVDIPSEFHVDSVLIDGHYLTIDELKIALSNGSEVIDVRESDEYE